MYTNFFDEIFVEVFDEFFFYYPLRALGSEYLRSCFYLVSKLTLQTCKKIQMRLQNNFGPIAKYLVDGGTFIMKHNLEQIVFWNL